MNILPYISEIIGAVFFTIIPVFIKKYDINILIKLLICTFATLIPSLMVIYYYNYKKYNDYDITQYFSNKMGVLIGIVSTIYYISFYYGFNLVPVSIGIPIFMITPFVMTLMDRYFNNIGINFGQIIGFLISFIGIIMVVFSKTSINTNNLILGSIAIIISVITYSYIYVKLNLAIPKNIDKESFLNQNIQLMILVLIPFIIFSILTIGSLLFTSSLPYKFELPTLKTILYLISVFIILSYIANLLYFYSYNNMPLSSYGVLENTEVIAAMVIGYLFLDEHMSLKKIFGSIIIVLGIVIEIFFKENKQANKMISHILPII